MCYKMDVLFLAKSILIKCVLIQCNQIISQYLFSSRPENFSLFYHGFQSVYIYKHLSLFKYSPYLFWHFLLGSEPGEGCLCWETHGAPGPPSGRICASVSACSPWPPADIRPQMLGSAGGPEACSHDGHT